MVKEHQVRFVSLVPKKNCGFYPLMNLKALKFHPRGTLHDEKISHGGEARRLVSKERFVGCIFSDTIYDQQLSERQTCTSFIAFHLDCHVPPSFHESDKTSSTFLRKRGIKLIIYLDDLLVTSTTPQSLIAQVTMI